MTFHKDSFHQIDDEIQNAAISQIHRISRKQAYDILKRNEQLLDEYAQSPIYYTPAMFGKKAQYFTDHEYNKIAGFIETEDSRMIA